MISMFFQQISNLVSFPRHSYDQAKYIPYNYLLDGLVMRV